MLSEYEQTAFLVLRKTPYSDSSLVVAGISPQFGQLHFLIRGERKVSRKKWPQVDLFRIFDITFRPAASNLHVWRSADLAKDFMEITQQPTTLWTAGRLGRFALRNVGDHVSSPEFFQAIRQALQRLCVTEKVEDGDRQALIRAAEVGPLLVFLHEHGLLPADDRNSRRLATLQQLLDMAKGEKGVPRLTDNDWRRLTDWCLSLLHFGGYRGW